jgi:hypothetical protein
MGLDAGGVDYCGEVVVEEGEGEVLMLDVGVELLLLVVGGQVQEVQVVEGRGRGWE